MNENRFEVPTNDWKNLNDEQKEKFNETFPEVQQQKSQIIQGLPQELKQVVEKGDNFNIIARSLTLTLIKTTSLQTH